MQVILLERIEKLGQMGDVVSVKPGYARNYLLPKNKALRATDENRRVFDAQKSQLEAQNLEHKKEAESVAAKMDGEKITLIRQAGEGGQLYGSVNARDVSLSLTEGGFTVSRQQVELAQPIKTLGIHAVRVRLHPEVIVTVNANVARTAEEAKMQAETGQAVVGGNDEASATEVAAQAAEAVAAQADDVFEDAVAEGVVADVEASVEAEAQAEEAAAADTAAKAELEAKARAAQAAEAAENSNGETSDDNDAKDDDTEK